MDKLLFSAAPETVQAVLTRQLRKTPPRGKVTANRLALYWRITGSNFRLMLLFCIHGKIESAEEGTEISFFIRPSLPSALLAALFLGVFAYSAVNSIATHSLNAFLWCSAGITALYFTMLFWQMSKCKSLFKGRLIQSMDQISQGDNLGDTQIAPTAVAI